MKKKLIVATHNEGKWREMKALLPDFEVLSLKHIAFTEEIAETGSTFLENATLKVDAIFKKTGGIVIADDSGLAIDALDGEPGVYSARFAGEDATDEKNIAKVLEKMQGVGMENRTAQFVCCIACRQEPDISFHVFGTCEGVIATEPMGDAGFGYDPIFVPENHHHTFAQLGSLVKDQISHRSIALSKLREILNSKSKISKPNA